MTPARTALTVRLATGGLFLLAPRQGLRLLGHADGGRARAVVRLLGARHLVQGAYERSEEPTRLRRGAAADLLHAGTAVAFSCWSAQGRRAGRRSAALAMGLAAAQLLAAAPPGLDQEHAGPPTDNGLPEHLVLLRGGVMDGATVVLDRGAAHYCITDSEHGLQRYVLTDQTARTIEGVSPVFVLTDGA
jgi:hypothetical protein